MEALLVIANSGAGTADEKALDSAVAVLRRRASVDVVHTANPGELDGALTRAGTRRIVVAGGDGSMHAVVSCLHRRHDLGKAVIGLLPLGTGNDFARGNRIPLDADEAAQLVLDGEVRPMDLILDEVGEVVVNNVHLGAGAQSSRRGHRWKKRLGAIGFGSANLGKLGYPIGAALSAFQPPYVRLCITVDGESVADYDHPVLMVAVGNGPQVGAGVEVTPEADPEDGQMDVMVSFATGLISRFVFVAATTAGRHVERKDVSYLRGSSVSVSGQEFWCSADGEVYGPERHRTWRVEPAAYSMILPPTSPGSAAR